MSVRGFAPGLQLLNPRGAWSYLAQKRKGNPSRASFMQNMRVNPGVVKCRPGTAVVFPTAAKVTSLFNWIEPLIPDGAPFSGAPRVSNGLLVLQIDQPEGSEQYIFPVGLVLFFGWSIAGPVETTASVAVSIDGVLQPAATIGIPRADVATAFPGNAGSPNFGWELTVDLTPYASGVRHSIVVTATDTAANTVTATAVFYVTRPPTGAENVVVYQEGATIQRYRQSDASIAALVTGLTTTRALTYAEIDVWLYLAGYDIYGKGTTQLRIYDGTNLDKGFRAPLNLAAVTLTDAGAGQCTQGTHYFGLVYQDRTGFAGVPQTALTVSGAPIAITLSSDQRTVNVSVNLPALPDAGGVATLFLIMTRADSPNKWYFVPTDVTTGSIGDLPVPYNMAITLQFAASISDADLAASADPADDQFLLLTQSFSGNGPFVPNFVAPYGTRMMYGVGTSMYVSEKNNPQQLTGDQSVVRMPNQRAIAYAFALPGSTNAFLTGDGWTAYITDNGDVPATWAPPVSISAALGAPFPACVCWRTRGNYVWIVTEGGPYLFDGQFSEKPVTYLVTDLWARVNWKAAYAITIADDVKALKCYLAVPLDGATEPTHMLTIDYTNGLAFDKVDISLDVFGWGQFSAIGVVREIATDTTNLWFGPASAGYAARFDDTSVNDVIWS